VLGKLIFSRFYGDYKWIFGLMTGFIELFDTGCDYTLQFNIKNTHYCSKSYLH
jgi:hypothetical protein